MSQPTPTWALRPPSARYEHLLLERVTMGALYVDALSHGAAMDDAMLLFGRIRQLDRSLGRFRRYSHDEHRVVVPAEDERWHVPGQPPVSLPPCRLCIKASLLLPLQLVLPTGTSARTDAHLDRRAA